MLPTEAELCRLHRDHAEAAYRLAWSVLGVESLAGDVVQELFLRLARDVSPLANARHERALLLTMTRNLALDHLRAAQRRDARERRWSAEALPVWLLPATDMEASDEQAALALALAELPEEQRTAIHLHLWEGLTFQQIGELCALPTQTVASRYRYGLAKLRAALATPELPHP